MVWGWECLSLQRPTLQTMQGLLASVPGGSFNHPFVAATETAPPLPADVVRDEWVLDHNRIKLGSGRKVFDRAKRALTQWQHMDLGWVQTNGAPISKGEKVCVSARSLFLWNRLPLEIVYTRQDQRHLPEPSPLEGFPANRKLQPQDALPPVSIQRGPGERFMFATSTLQGHQLLGEERFSLEWHQSDNSVWYEIYTISKPATPLAKLTYPLVRFHQKHFAKQSLRKMIACADGSNRPTDDLRQQL